MKTITPGRGPQAVSQQENITKKQAALQPVVAGYKAKRAMDILLGLAGLAILAPVMGIVALCIIAVDKMPPFFIQERVGLHSKKFKCYKFRTMKEDCPAYLPKGALDSKRYITKLGGFIRRYSIDELPQLANVLKGDMSIVGPRPLIEGHYNIHAQRLAQGISFLKPGLTGLAQIMGRDELSDEQKVEYDKEYLENCSFGYDLKIIAKTFGVVFTRKGYKES
ncbi:MAG: sugar transferase [Eubacteriaceae bacterium]|nr:sugar transferase [Eubacteriaceae bacterium]